MNSHRHSSPDFADSAFSRHGYDDSALQGVATTVKLLLKLVEDHKEACHKEKNDPRRMLRVAGMMTVLENIRTRIQKCQSFGNRRSSAAELKRCESDVRHRDIPRDKRPSEEVGGAPDENEKLRNELSTSMAARKSLQVMCSSLGKEKQIMAAELSKKVHELNEMEELINDLREQNQTLLAKVKEHASSDHMDRSEGEAYQGDAALQDRNRALSEQLLRSLDGYRSMKRKLKGAQEENRLIRESMEEIGDRLRASLGSIRALKEPNASDGDQLADIEADMAELEHMFASLDMKISKHGKKKGECSQAQRGY